MRSLMDSSENSLTSWANHQRYERGLGDEYVLAERGGSSAPLIRNRWAGGVWGWHASADRMPTFLLIIVFLTHPLSFGNPRLPCEPALISTSPALP